MTQNDDRVLFNPYQTLDCLDFHPKSEREDEKLLGREHCEKSQRYQQRKRLTAELLLQKQLI
jgi:hypothetical protein